jgi:hypothetical protein
MIDSGMDTTNSGMHWLFPLVCSLLLTWTPTDSAMNSDKVLRHLVPRAAIY